MHFWLYDTIVSATFWADASHYHLISLFGGFGEDVEVQSEDESVGVNLLVDRVDTR